MGAGLYEADLKRVVIGDSLRSLARDTVIPGKTVRQAGNRPSTSSRNKRRRRGKLRKVSVNRCREPVVAVICRRVGEAGRDRSGKAGSVACRSNRIAVIP